MTRLGAVNASSARGIRLARITYLTKLHTRRLQIVVVVRDVERRLIRDAIVTASQLPSSMHTILGSVSTYTNRFGRARLSVPLTARMLGKRLFFRLDARTPTAHALAIGAVRLPVLGHHG